MKNLCFQLKCFKNSILKDLQRFLSLKIQQFLIMNSSTGFKKRSLLRPPSGLRERERQYLKVFDISQGQPMIANQVKNQLIRIQQQINQLDKDKKIRSGQGSSLQKSYVITLKKWLREYAPSLQKQDDDLKILKHMGVDSYEAGFRKLWKITTSLDYIVSKITQLEIIQLLKYDEMFDQLCKQSQKNTNILSMIGKTGFTPGTFQISQVLLDRSKDIYSTLAQSKRKGGSSFITNSDKQNNKKSQTNQLIAQLQKQNSKLSELLEELQKQKQNNQKLMKQLKNKEQIIKVNQNIANNATKINITSSNNQVTSNNNSTDVFRQLEDRYTQRLAYIGKENSRLESLLSEQKIVISSLETKLRLAQEELRQKDSSKGLKAKSGTYEQALLEEMQKMRKGFQKKIQKIMEQYGQKQKQMRKKQIDYKNENQKIKWQKNLLLKKFDAFQQIKAK